MVVHLSRSDLRPKPIHYLTVAYGLVLSIFSIDKVFQFNTQSYDMAIFQQLFWNTLHGRFMFTMPECCYPAHPPNFIGSHFSPLVLLLLPIYFVYQSPYTLLVIQSFALALPAVFIHKIASKRLGRGATWTIVAAYLLYPGVLWPALSDFHLEAFVPLAYVMIFYFWERDRTIPFILSYLFLLSTFEDSAVIGLAFLVYAYLKSRKHIGTRRVGVAVLAVLGIVSLAWLAGASYAIQATWPQRGAQLTNYWSLTNIGVDLVAKLQYWLFLIVPLAFAPLLSPIELIPAGPWFLASVFSNFAIFYTIPWQYSALVAGQIVVASIFALQKLERFKFHRAAVALTMVGLVTLSPFGVYAMANHPAFVPSLPSENVYAGHSALSVIPPNATVLAQDNILPFLVDRQASVFSDYPNDTAPPSYIALDLPAVYYFQHDPPDAPIQRQAQKFLGEYSYGLAASADGFLVYELNYAGPPKVYVPYDVQVTAGQFLALPPQVLGASGIYVAPGSHGRDWSGPWISLGPGRYRVTFLFDNLAGNSSITLDAYSTNTSAVIVERAVTFPSTGHANATLDVVLSGIVPEIEFRGVVRSNQSSNLYFQGLQVSQMSAP